MIEQINYLELQQYINELKNSGLVFCDKTLYYGNFEKSLRYGKRKMVGFTGIIIYKNKAIFKNHFIFKEYRGKGYFKQLFDFSIKLTKELGIKKVEATCTDMSINHYLKNGFKVIKEFKKYKKVCNENI